MRRVGPLACLCCLIVAAAPAPQKKSARPPAKAPATPAKQQSPKKATTSGKKRPSPSKKSKSKSKKRLPSWRTSQQVPTRERYTEIQQALISRGYLPEPASGVWGPESVEALKKFQASQNLEPSGKLDSLSLIALGLGPKRAAEGSPPPPPAVSALKQP